MALTLQMLRARIDRDSLQLFVTLAAPQPRLTRSAVECYDMYVESLQPWVQKKTVTRRSEIEQAEAAWVEAFGDPDTPEMQERIARTVAFLERKGQ